MHPQNFVPNPFVWKKEEKILSFDSATMNRKIFETTFSGIKKGNGGLFTRTDDSFVGFRLDKGNGGLFTRTDDSFVGFRLDRP
ncbi:hypothetical protein ACA29_01515 [Lederbergia galactosidilytica]|uniref:Uncharacterized protein n=1 Tax=Lederbergia galactosidilytica TaxID=217031 RepID=A0A0Q9Y834_9BACI|nr:hypothetical protein ACA29_01515 [Lederbergia galactosidilytica]